MIQRLVVMMVVLAAVAFGCSAHDSEEDVGTLTQSATVPTGFIDEAVVAGLASPTAMKFAPDGRLFVCQQGGALRVIKNGVLLTTPAVQLSVNSAGERGLLGIAFDPQFASNRHIYLYYTTSSSPIHNRLSRFTLSSTNPDVVAAGSELQILNLPTLSSATNHNGGAIHFGSDGKLYIAVGENANGANAQSLSTTLGKLLRINSNGTIPGDNPFVAQTTGINQAIWALGLRNPFTFDVQAGTGRIFINDVGQNTWEEINDGIAGSNYGWPTTEGPTTNPSFRSPLFAYQHSQFGASNCAITGGAFYPNSGSFPSSFFGKYFFADFCGNWIRVFDVNTGTSTGFATGLSSPVDLKVGPDGALYYLQRGGGGEVRRVRSSANEAPAITSHPANATVAAGQTAVFTVSASGTPPLQYQWQRGTTNIAGATNATLSFTATAGDNGATFRAVVSNAFGTATSNSATLTVITNAAPTANISAPSAGATYRAGDTINFSGSGTDPEDGALPASALTWEVVFHHDTHTHPFIQPFSGQTSGSFVIPNRGETATNVFYRIHLTVRDSGGLTHSVSRDILPQTSTITLQANPSGLQVTLDGQPLTTPSSVGSVIGMIRTLGAVSPQTFQSNNFVFSSWSDGGAQTHEITTPATNSSFTANFVQSSCAADAVAFNGHCYHLLTSSLTYLNARNACRARGTGWSLVEIASSAENTFVQNLIGNQERWIGGHDRTTEGAFFWESGLQFWSGGLNGGPVGGRFTNFASGEPNNAGGSGSADCVRMVSGGQWRDTGCSSVFRAVCESGTI